MYLIFLHISPAVVFSMFVHILFIYSSSCALCIIMYYIELLLAVLWSLTL